MELTSDSAGCHLIAKHNSSVVISTAATAMFASAGEMVETVSDFILGAPKSLHMVTAAMKLKDAYSLEEKL